MTFTGDLFYYSELGWPVEIIEWNKPNNILFIGEIDQEFLKKAIEIGCDVRNFETNRRNFPKGITFFKKNKYWNLVISSIGTENRPSLIDARQDFIPDDDILILLIERFINFWSESHQLGSVGHFLIGDTVQVKADNSLGKVDKIIPIQGQIA
jgi:hypothetical protein